MQMKKKLVGCNYEHLLDIKSEWERKKNVMKKQSR